MKNAVLFLLVATLMMIPILSPCRALDHSIPWTEDQLSFMTEHPVIRLGVDPGFVPFEFINEDGQYVGIAADYLALISERTGLQFEVVKGLTWPEAYDLALAGDIHVLPSVGITAERASQFLYSEPYYYFQRVIVTRDEDTSVSALEDLAGYAVAVQRNSSHHSYLLDYAKVNLSLYDSVERALTAVATGEEKAFLGNLATTNYTIRLNALTNLRFVAFEAEKGQSLHFAVHKDFPELVTIINTVLDTITESERLAIHNKWVALSGDGIDCRPLIRGFAIIGSFAAIVLAVSSYWIVKLRKEIQERIRIQEDLQRAKQAADEANEFKSSFVARMSHEIRTPLHAITGMTYLLKQSNLTSSQKMYADSITQASSNMLHIVNDILDYSKVEAGRIEMEVTPFNMNQVIQNVVNIVLYKIQEQEIGFKLAQDPLLPNWFLGDSKRIEQVLLNLLDNAAKFTNEGEILLEISLIAREEDLCHLSFTIKDTGIGMDEEQIKKLFDPFVQGDSTINRRFGGSGLGLSIVKNLVDLMGGKLQVSSTPNEGSTFIVQLSLPIDREKDEPNLGLVESHCELATSTSNAPGMLEKVDGKTYTVMVVEDNKTNQLISQSFLQQMGIESLLASDGKEAVELYEQHQDKISLILMDLHMPVMDGYEAAKIIKDMSPSVPMVAMTADVMLDVKEKCAASGLHHFLSKPFDPDEFIGMVRELIFTQEKEPSPKPQNLDRVAGLRNMGGNVDIYQQVLAEYFNENRGTADKLALAIHDKRYAEAAQIVHKVKGSSGSIGAKLVYELAIRLQKALHERDEEQSELLGREFGGLLRNLLEEISQN